MGLFVSRVVGSRWFIPLCILLFIAELSLASLIAWVMSELSEPFTSSACSLDHLVLHGWIGCLGLLLGLSLLLVWCSSSLLFSSRGRQIDQEAQVRRGLLASRVLITGALAWEMQRYLLSGYGVQNLPYISLLQMICHLSFPLLGGWVTYLLTSPPSTAAQTGRARRMLRGSLSLTTGLFGVVVLTSLPEGYEVATVCALWISALHLARLISLQLVSLHPSQDTAQPLERYTLSQRAWSFASALFLILSALYFISLPQDRMRRVVARYPLVRAALQRLPLQSSWLPPLEIISKDVELLSWRRMFRKRFHKERVSHHSVDPAKESGPRNVIVIILESIRWDVWSDPEVTPRFHQWRDRGVYVPRAVAQYPATPLAYASLFLSQTPSVVTRSTEWLQHRPLDALHDHFSGMFLSRPNNVWFKDGAITGFMTDKVKFKTHRSSSLGLRDLKQFIQKRSGESSGFFSWVHLYEPHKTWRSHSQFKVNPKDYPAIAHAKISKRRKLRKAKYYSEVKYIDHHLGEFMDWFYQQDLSEDTLVWVMADHGQGLYDRLDGKLFTGHHVHVHSQISWVPCYVSGPAVPRGQLREGLEVSQLDMMPTIFDHLGLTLPRSLYAQGVSLFETLERSEGPPRPLSTEAFSIRGKALFSMLKAVRTGDVIESAKLNEEIRGAGKYPPKVAIQLGEMKLIYNRLLAQAKFYNIKEDPNESKRLSLKQNESRALLTELHRWSALQDWIVEQSRRLSRERLKSKP